VSPAQQLQLPRQQMLLLLPQHLVLLLLLSQHLVLLLLLSQHLVPRCQQHLMPPQQQQ
jgi:hypothetical protein